MRFLWALVVACVVAATGVRPAIEVREQLAGQVDRAPAGLDFVATRPQLSTLRGHAPRPHDARLPAGLANPPPSVAPPHPRALDATRELTHTTLAGLLPASRTSRGPPVAALA